MSRRIINISLPEQMAARVKKAVATGNYASVSEYFRFILREHEENSLLSQLRASQRTLRRGKGKILRSLKDLR